jgi:DNA (cytosine-5)-methyltransferase 1
MKSIQTEFVLVKEAASMLGVCPNTIRTWGADGKLTEHRHPINGYRLYKREEIDHLIELMRKPAHPRNPK